MDNINIYQRLCKNVKDNKQCSKCIWPIASPIFLSKLSLYDTLGLIIACLSETNIYKNYFCTDLTYCNCAGEVSVRTVNIADEYIYAANIVAIKYILETWRFSRKLDRNDKYKFNEVQQVLDITSTTENLSIGLDLLFKSKESWSDK